MLPPAPHHRLVVWLHWVVANAAAFGAIGAWIEISERYDLWNNDLTVPWQIAISLIPIGLILLLGIAQQLILKRGGLRAGYWILFTGGGFLAGMMACLFADEVSYKFIEPAGCIRVTGTPLGISAWVLVLGGVQSWSFSRTFWQHLAWTICTFLATFAAIIVPGIGGQYFQNLSFVVSGTLAGATYGLVTGRCLVWLMHAQRQFPPGQSSTTIDGATRTIQNDYGSH